MAKQMKRGKAFDQGLGKNLPENFSEKDVFYRYYIVFIFAFVLILGSGIVLWYVYNQTTEINKNAAINDVEHFATSVSKFRNFYSQVVVPAASAHGMVITHDYVNKKGTLPLPATFAKDFGNSLSSKDSNFNVKLYSDLPFPWRNEKLDAFEKKAIKQLRKNPDEPIWSFETMNGQPVLRYARADIMKKSCIGCHNRYQGTPKTNWKAGDVRGVLEVIRPMSVFASESSGMLKNSFLMMIVLILSMVMLIFFVLRKLSASIRIAQNSYKIARNSFRNSEKANIKLVEEIQHRKKVSHSLKRSDVKMRAIQNSVQEVIIVINKVGMITECNNVVEDMFGYTPNEILGQNVSILMTGSHQTSHDAYIQKYLTGKVGSVMGQNREFFAIRKNGKKFPIELFVNDARVDNEIIFTGTIRDITLRKKVEESTASAHKAAVESAELKSEFLANMSHEIRTPMNGVIGMTEMLLLSKLDEEQKELAQTVRESASSLLVIINDILDFSKIEAGKLSIKKNEFQLLHMIEACIDLISKEAERKYLDIAFFINEGVPSTIIGDAGRLRQILINLLNNAMKFTEQGHVILQVSLLDDTHIHFAIIDTGTGIAEKDQKTLFDMFSQVDGSSSREHGGTGLGLAICKQLTELMGGKIGAKSKVDVGSTFWFTIEIEPQKKLSKPYIVAPVNVLMLNTSSLLSSFFNRQMKDWRMTPTIVTNLNHFMMRLDQSSFQLLVLDTDNIYIDSSDTSHFLDILKSIRMKTSEAIILYATRVQLRKLEDIDLGNNIYLMNKPIKHTMIKLLLNKVQNEGKVDHKTKMDERLLPKDNNNLKKIEYNQKNIVEGNKGNKGKNIPPQLTEEKQAQPLIKKFHVLLAEDNRVNQMVAVAILNKFGCEVTVAVNGEEALKSIDNDMFDVVFMDCQMPIMDGYEASSRIRNLADSHHSKNIPIIAFTANAMKDDDVKCKEAGMDDYLSKPIDMDEFKKVFARWNEPMLIRRKTRLSLIENKSNQGSQLSTRALESLE